MNRIFLSFEHKSMHFISFWRQTRTPAQKNTKRDLTEISVVPIPQKTQKPPKLDLTQASGAVSIIAKLSGEVVVSAYSYPRACAVRCPLPSLLLFLLLLLLPFLLPSLLHFADRGFERRKEGERRCKLFLSLLLQERGREGDTRM